MDRLIRLPVSRAVAAYPASLLLALGMALAPTAGAQAVDPEFASFDRNGDGRIAPGEFEDCTHELFDAMDDDPDDDKLTVAEVMRSEARFLRYVFTTGNILGTAELGTREKLQRLDSNHDGAISQTEYLNATAAKFQHMDGDNNGELTPDEFASGL
jgi:Ca2+-binding EF-hand superfamily protein